MFFFRSLKEIHIFDEQFTDADQFSFLNLLGGWQLFDGWEEELFEKFEDIFFAGIFISSLEDETEEETFWQIFILENYFEFVYILHDKFDQFVAG